MQILEDFAGIFLEDFSGHCFPTEMSRKNPATKSTEKIRQRQPKNRNPREIRSARNRPYPVGQKRHPDVAGQKLPRDNCCLCIVSALSRNCPHRGGHFERGEKRPSLVGERQFGRHSRRLFGRGSLRVKNCRETVGRQFCRETSCRETSRCLAGPSGQYV